MASITDCVVEGLKYPFNDIKKLLGFGVLFVILDLLSMAFTMKTLDITRAITHTLEQTNGHLSTLPFSQLPSGNIYMAIGILIVGFIVTLFIMGYQYDVVKFSINKKEDLPGFTNILGMFINGIKYFIVTLAYALPALIVMFLGIVLIGNSSILPVVIVIAGLLSIIAFFLLIMALNNMVAHGSLKKAFDFGEIMGNISNLGWVKYIGTVLFTMIVFAIINVAVGVILSFLTALFAAAINNQAMIVSIFITVIEGLFVSSYCSVFYNRVCGSIYRESIK
jgi:hypothetical protein